MEGHCRKILIYAVVLVYVEVSLLVFYLTIRIRRLNRFKKLQKGFKHDNFFTRYLL